MRLALRPLLATVLAVGLSGTTQAADRAAIFAGIYGDLTGAVVQPLADRAGEINILEYYPLPNGASWTYVDKAAGDKPLTLKVEGRTTYAGVPVVKVAKVGATNSYDMIVDQGKLKLVFRMDENNGPMDFSDDAVPFSQGTTVKVGDVYTATPKKFVNPVTGGNLQWTVAIKGFKDIATPKANFTQCLQLDVRNKDTKSGLEVSNFSMYLAKGVGLVRRDGRFIATNFKHLLTASSLVP